MVDAARAAEAAGFPAAWTVHLSRELDALTVLGGGRLTLGVGMSHRSVIEGMHGLAYTSPAAHIATGPEAPR